MKHPEEAAARAGWGSPGPIAAIAGEVLDNRPVASTLFRLRVRMPAGWGPLLPGQFVSITLEPRWEEERSGDGGLALLRRPFSVAACDEQDGHPVIDLIYAAVGKVTRRVVDVRPGAMLEILGPAGTPFPRIAGAHHLLVGGGRGIAPMLLTARALLGAGEACSLFYGTRTCEEWLDLGDLEPLTRRATEDGRGGVQGTVIDLLDGWTAGPLPAVVQACGPHGMLEAVAHWAQRHALACWVSVEEVFGCSAGICGGCAVPVRAPAGPYQRFLWACREGAVVAAERIDWDAWRSMHA